MPSLMPGCTLTEEAALASATARGGERLLRRCGDMSSLLVNPSGAFTLTREKRDVDAGADIDGNTSDAGGGTAMAPRGDSWVGGLAEATALCCCCSERGDTCAASIAGLGDVEGETWLLA